MPVIWGHTIILVEQSRDLVRAELKANIHISHFVYACFHDFFFTPDKLWIFLQFLFLSPSCPATCSSVSWYLVFKKNGFMCMHLEVLIVVFMLQWKCLLFVNWSFWHIWQTDCMVLLTNSLQFHCIFEKFNEFCWSIFPCVFLFIL